MISAHRRLKQNSSIDNMFTTAANTSPPLICADENLSYHSRLCRDKQIPAVDGVFSVGQSKSINPSIVHADVRVARPSRFSSIEGDESSGDIMRKLLRLKRRLLLDMTHQENSKEEANPCQGENNFFDPTTFGINAPAIGQSRGSSIKASLVFRHRMPSQITTAPAFPSDRDPTAYQISRCNAA